MAITSNSINPKLTGPGLGVVGAGAGQAGHSNPDQLKAGFPDSPIHDETVTMATQVDIFKDLLGSESMDENTDFAPGVGLNYNNGAPSIIEGGGDVTVATDATAGLGLPATPFVPNVVSPGQVDGATNLSYTTVPRSFPEASSKTTRPPGEGPGSALSPQASSIIIGAQDFTDLTMGSSS